MHKYIIEDFIRQEHCQLLIDHYEKNKHKCSDGRAFHAKRTLHYENMTNPTIQAMLKYYFNKTCYFIDHYFQDKVSPWSLPRICRWHKGEIMKMHADKIGPDKMKYSSLIYLNDNYEGGEIKFKDENPMKLKAGSCILFESDTPNAHQVLKVKKGYRYTIPSWYTDKILFTTL
tara:strand:- start:536 stop:1054 length:519 start_codon:yes stop_codon:yes gene_type:complete